MFGTMTKRRAACSRLRRRWPDLDKFECGIGGQKPSSE